MASRARRLERIKTERSLDALQAEVCLELETNIEECVDIACDDIHMIADRQR